jgi:hypothetical protein
MHRSAALAAVVFAVLCAAPALADEHIYTYEPVSPAAHRLAPTGLSFRFQRHLMGGARIQRIIQTGERGSAAVKPASEAALGGGLKAILADAHGGGDLYEILPEGDGKPFVQAVCPGAERAWLLFGPLERFRDLTVRAIGKASGEAGAHLCVALDFTFHGELSVPPDRNAPRVRMPVNK